MDTEFWRQLRVPPEPTRLVVPVRLSRTKRITRKMKSIRDAIFRLIMPGLFLTLVYYHAFVYSPEVPRFYAQLMVESCVQSGG